MGMSVGENKGGAMAEMNVVPLIDILLVLLIIFMVITPLTPKGLDTLVPQPNPNQQQNQDLENKTVVVQVTKDGKVKINNEDSTWDRLGPRIEQIFKERAEKVAFVKGDNEVLFEEVARSWNRQGWFDHCQAGSRSIDFVRRRCFAGVVRVLLAGSFLVCEVH
jgi:biopolymer transport protein ExbD